MNKANGKTSDSVYDMKPWQPMTFSMTESNGVIVRALHDTKDKEMIIFLDSTGRKECVFENHGDSEPLFIYLLCAQSTSNDFLILLIVNRAMKSAK